MLDTAGRVLRTADIPAQVANISARHEIPYTLQGGFGVRYYYPPFAAYPLMALSRPCSMSSTRRCFNSALYRWYARSIGSRPLLRVTCRH